MLLEEFDKVANLLDIQTHAFVTDTAVEDGSDQENNVPPLKILDIRKSSESFRFCKLFKIFI